MQDQERLAIEETINNMGVVYRIYKSSISRFKELEYKAEAYHTTAKTLVQISDLYNQLGNEQKVSEKRAEALELYNAAIEIIQKSPELEILKMAPIYIVDRAVLHLTLGNEREAVDDSEIVCDCLDNDEKYPTIPGIHKSYILSQLAVIKEGLKDSLDSTTIGSAFNEIEAIAEEDGKTMDPLGNSQEI